MPSGLSKEPAELLRDFYDHAPCGFHSVDAEGVFVQINNTELEWLGYTRQELVGKRKVQDLLSAASREVFFENFEKLKAQDAVRDIELELVARDGTVIPVLVSATAVRDDNGKFLMSRAIVCDMRERKAANQMMLRLAALAEAAPDAIMEIDQQGRILLVNEAAEKLFGYCRSELLDLSVEELVPLPLRDTHRQHRLNYKEHPKTRPMGVGMVLNARRKDGSEVPVEISLSPNYAEQKLRVIAIVRDITERKQLENALRQSEEKLRQAEKLEALARLAGGTAHEFNNLLTMIMGYAELLQPAVADTDVLNEYVERIRSAARRAASLTRQLLAFGRKQVLLPQVIDLNALLVENGPVLARLMGHSISTTVLSAPGPAWISADTTQIEMIIANLVSNARDAMPKGGKLTLAVRTFNLQQNEAAPHPALPAGGYVELRVSDSGAGMTPQVQARLFEPFFSTRELGKGAGLGLATVYGVVTQSGGAISVESKPGEGTTFHIFLPRLSEDEAARNQKLETEIESLPGTETILVAEDQPPLLALASHFLEKLGYRVLPAENAEQALEISRNYENTIDLLLTDIVMPATNGRELARKLKAARPEMKVLYVSGYAEEAGSDPDFPAPGESFLEKPFQLDELAHKVRQVLQGRSARILPFAK